MSEFTDVQEQARNIAASFGARDETNAAIEDIYLMRDKMITPTDVGVVETRAPDNRNAVKGAARLLSIPEPVINVPADADTLGTAEKLELMGATLLDASDHFSRKPLHNNAALSSLLYDEVEIVVVSTKDLLEGAKKGLAKERAQEISRATPYLFKCRKPGYPVWDDFGLCAHARTSMLTVAQIMSQYPEGRGILESMSYDMERDTSRLVQVWDFWDREMHYAWLESASAPLVEGKHKLPMIPIACRISEGSDLFDDPSDQREPFLLTEYRSGLGARKNMMLTALYTKLYNMGFVTPFMWSHTDPGSERPALMQDGIFQYVDVGTGKMEILKHEMDPAFETGLNIAERKGQESTLYSQTLGGPMPTGTAFSTYSLLTQTGRLPLETIRRMTGEALADVLRIAFRWMKHDAGKYSARSYKQGKFAELEAKDIPEYFEIGVSLDIALPQDALQQANIVNMLWDKVPGQVLFEKILKLGQWETLNEQLMSEQMDRAMFQVKVQQEVQRAMQPPQVPGEEEEKQAAEERMLMNNERAAAEQVMLPEQMAQQPQGLPVEQAMAGGQGPEGSPMMPPGGVL